MTTVLVHIVVGCGHGKDIHAYIQTIKLFIIFILFEYAHNALDIRMHDLYILGPPSSVSNITTSSGCLSTLVSWNSVTSNQACGELFYDVTISSSDGVVLMMDTTIQTSYNFTGLTPDNSYTVTVAGRNDAGMGQISNTSVMAPVKGDYT